MKALLFSLLLSSTASASLAEIIVAARTIPASQVIMPEDLALRQGTVAGGLGDADLVIGMEARTAIYPGRPIRSTDLRPPAVVERNEMITLHFRQGGLRISAEGRALDRAAPGDTIRVMNLASRNTVFATIAENGSGHVSN